MQTRPITVAETQAFVRSAEKLWSEQERAELVDHLAHNPEAGDLIPGTGGVRKVRWGRSGSGKRGARVISITAPIVRSTCCWPMRRRRRRT